MPYGKRAINIGDKVRTIHTGDFRTEDRLGIVEDIVHLPAKYEKSALTKYYVRFLDKKSEIVHAQMVREELKKVI